MSLEKNHEIKWVETNTLKNHPDNNNKHPKEQIERLVKVIKYQGFRAPITVSNRSGYIVAGHARVKAAKEMGLKKLPVMFQDFDDEAQEYAHLTADNALALWSKIDMDSVEEFAKSLDPDFDVDFLGFSDFELKDDLDYGDSEKDDVVPETDENEFDVKLGDIWQLGEHRVMCGDSTCEKTVAELMNGEKADMVFTDPPYGISYKSNHRKDKKAFKELVNDDTFLDFKDAMLSVSKEETVFYIWTSHQVFHIWRQKYLDRYKSTIIWYKKNGGMGDLEAEYGHNYEMCLYLTNSRKKFTGPRPKAVWDFNLDDTTKFIHPTQKPTSLACNAFEHHNNSKNILDLFLGSGSTLIACEKTNRKCFGMELDPHYVSVIIKRWQDYTGKKAVKIDG